MPVINKSPRVVDLNFQLQVEYSDSDNRNDIQQALLDTIKTQLDMMIDDFELCDKRELLPSPT